MCYIWLQMLRFILWAEYEGIFDTNSYWIVATESQFGNAKRQLWLIGGSAECTKSRTLSGSTVFTKSTKVTKSPILLFTVSKIVIRTWDINNNYCFRIYCICWSNCIKTVFWFGFTDWLCPISKNLTESILGSVTYNIP